MNKKGKIIKKTVQALLKKLDLMLIGTDLDRFDFSHHTFYSLVIQKDFKEKQTLFFKTLISDEKYKKQTFLSDTIAHTFFTEQKSSFTPHILRYNIYTKPYWMLRYSIDGKLSGDRIQFYKPFYSYVSFSQLFRLISSLQKLTPRAKKFFKANKMELKKRNSDWFIHGFNKDYDFSAFYTDIQPEFLKQKTVQKINQFFKRNKRLLDTNLSLTHGDIHGENLFMLKKHIKLIDWENIHLNNRLFDWGYIWLNSWNNLGFRSLLEKRLIKNSRDHSLFVCNKIRWLIRMIGLLHHGTKAHQKGSPKYKRLINIRNIHIRSLNHILKKEI